MVNQFRKYIEVNCLFSKEDRILLAVSGGIDSMVMADLFIKSGYNIGIAHCNFTLRGTESDKDELLVEQLAQSNCIPFYLARFNTEQYAKENSISIQMAARELRYSWFRDMCAEHSYKYIATAHNLDDKVETFFLNLTRGTGIKGLSGMPAKRDDIIHPILFASRVEIVHYAKENGVLFREDATNATTHYARNRIRHNVIPELQKVNPSFYATMDQNMLYIMQAEEFVQKALSKLKIEACKQQGDMLTVNIDGLKRYQPISLFLYELLSSFGFNSSVVNDIESSLSEQAGKQFFSQTHRLVKNREELLISPKETEESGEYEITEDTAIDTPINLVLDVIQKEQVCFNKDQNVAYFDAEKIEYPLVLRKWKTGDCFTPFGMKGKKKLSDFFIDSKVSLLEKKQQWLLLSGAEVIWVVGLRIDNRYRIEDKTEKVLRIQYIKKPAI